MRFLDISVLLSYRAPSFIPKRIDQIGVGSFESLIAGCEKGDSNRKHSGENKSPNTYLYLIGKILEPFVHEVKSERPGDKIGNKDEYQKVFR